MVVGPLDLAPPALIETRNNRQHAAEPVARHRELVPRRVDHLLLDREIVGGLFHFEVGLDGAGVGGAVGAVRAEVEEGADCGRAGVRPRGSVFRKRQLTTRRQRTVGRRHVAVRAMYHREQSLSPSVERSERRDSREAPGYAQGRFPAKQALEDDNNLVHLCSSACGDS